MSVTVDHPRGVRAAAAIDRAQLVGRTAALREDLQAQADDADRRRQLTGAAIDAITGAGLLRLMTPRRSGGYPTAVRTFLEVTTELGRWGCSAAWVTGILNAGSFLASRFPAPAQEEVSAQTPDARVALALVAPHIDVEHAAGGIRLTGQWPYSSGSAHADWMCVLIPCGTRAPGREVHLALVPAADVHIRDTWHVAGMRGTGSNTIVADRVFVPHHRAIPVAPLLEGSADHLAEADHEDRNSLMGVFSVGLLGSLLGRARPALDYVLEHCPRRPVAATAYANQTDSPSFGLDVSRAATALDMASLLAARIAGGVDAAAVREQFPDMLTRTRSRLESTRVAELCREALDGLMTVYGSSAFAQANPLQRIWRDVYAASRHAAFGTGIPAQMHGRALVGGEPRALSFLI